ncbi:MAG: peptide-methionine (S)-S-oxide reductase MsrA [Steroidobacteraceae bacterium]
MKTRLALYGRPMLLALAAVVTAVLAVALLIGIGHPSAGAADSQLPIPPPAVDEPLAGTSGTETAILSGGCFWGMQLVFQHVKGVREALAGYTGGAARTARYGQVSTGTTGHAESIEIVFDPHLVSYGTLLRIYFSVATDPTELDYQGPDEGTQYRGEIWPMNGVQRHIAESYVRQLAAAHVFRAPIVTRIDGARPFYPAESYHQNFATAHPYYPYIMAFDAPKAAALARMFPDLYLARPTQVGASQRP